MHFLWMEDPQPSVKLIPIALEITLLFRVSRTEIIQFKDDPLVIKLVLKSIFN
jgi:hypothetical protein